MVYFIALIICVIFGFVGSGIANEKNREPLEGFLYGFFLSVFGLIIVAVLPSKEEKKIKSTTVEQSEKDTYIRTERSYVEEIKTDNNDSRSRDKVIWLILFFALIIVLVLVGINSADNKQTESIPYYELKLNNEPKINDSSITQFGSSNQNVEEKQKTIKNSTEIIDKQKSKTTKEDRIIILSKVFDSVYGKEIAIEIARQIYSDKLNLDSIRSFTLEDGGDKLLTQYKNIKLFNSKNKLLYKFDDVRIQGFIEYGSKYTSNKYFKPTFLLKRNNLSEKELSVYPYKRRLFIDLVNKLDIEKEYVELMLKHIDNQRALLTGHRYDSIALAITDSDFAIIHFYFVKKYQGSIDFPFSIPK